MSYSPWPVMYFVNAAVMLTVHWIWRLKEDTGYVRPDKIGYYECGKLNLVIARDKMDS